MPDLENNPVVADPAPAAPAAAPASDMADRTREQFEKLLESNRKLNERLEQTTKEISALKTVQPAQPQGNAQPSVSVNDFVEVDATTGEKYINEQRLQKRIEELDEIARRAQQRTEEIVETSNKKEFERQNREAFNAFPELNPKSPNYDSVFHMQVRALVTDSYVNPGDYDNRPLEIREAAERVRGWRAPAAPATPAPEAPKGDDDSKRQATAEPGSTPNVERTPANEADLQRLKFKTRGTGPDATAALIERLKYTDHIAKTDRR